ncbi:hypothetical protein BH09PSE3_BH09PSE3_00170 [soil metagenome]
MTKRTIILIAIASLITAAASHWYFRQEPTVLTAKELANQKAIESLKETQDEVQKLKAHGIK